MEHRGNCIFAFLVKTMALILLITFHRWNHRSQWRVARRGIRGLNGSGSTQDSSSGSRIIRTKNKKTQHALHVKTSFLTESVLQLSDLLFLHYLFSSTGSGLAPSGSSSGSNPSSTRERDREREREAMDPIAELLSQLSGVRRGLSGVSGASGLGSVLGLGALGSLGGALGSLGGIHF